MTTKKYPSKYSNGKFVSSAQYITELICEKMAKIEKKDLHYRFWINPEWAEYYKNQIAAAYSLIKKYPETAIIRALNSPRAEKIYSLRAPHLPPMIECEAKILESENQELTKTYSRDNKTHRVALDNKKSLLSKLEEIDNEP